MSEVKVEQRPSCPRCAFAQGAICTRDPKGPFLRSYEVRYGDSDFCGPTRRYFKPKGSLLATLFRSLRP